MKASAPLLYLREEELTDGVELFFFAGRDVGRSLDGALGRLGLGRAHARAIHFIARHPGLSVSDLLGILAITKQSLGRVIKDLHAQGLVSQATGQKDRRQRLLNLTDRGREVARELASLQRALFARAFRSAGPDAVAGFRQVLSGLINEEERAGVMRLIAKR
ncbi:MAG: MarR family transcriptional regulator [Alphaproteobacteria bacterium]|nr:MarR family transcriptional regulator [Alphaproteobacteria bacterium]